MEYNGSASLGSPNSTQQYLKVDYMNGCRYKELNLQCIYNTATHKEHTFRNNIMGTPSFIVPSRHVHSFVLGPIGAEVAWHVEMRSLPCHIASSYLALLTGY